jgi:hypothetical protein
MQVIAVGSTAQDLCTKLASVAVPGFFDSVEMAEGSTTTVECKKNDVVVFEIFISGTASCTFPDGNSCRFYRQQTYSDYINAIVVMDKAIVLRNAYGNGAFVMIAKDTNGDLAFSAHTDGSIVNPYASGAIAQSVVIFKENGDTVTRFYYTNNDDTNKKAYFVPLFVNDDVFVDGVYVGLVRPYPNEPGYITFTIGSTGYVGFGGTFLITEST